jgi:hypothetical protein
VLPLEQVWQLAQVWYAGRAEEHWTPRSPEAVEQLFASLGLTGAFWSLP